MQFLPFSFDFLNEQQNSCAMNNSSPPHPLLHRQLIFSLPALCCLFFTMDGRADTLDVAAYSRVTFSPNHSLDSGVKEVSWSEK